MATIPAQLLMPRTATLAGGTAADLAAACKNNPGVLILQPQVDTDGVTVNALKAQIFVHPNLYNAMTITFT